MMGILTWHKVTTMQSLDEHIGRKWLENSPLLNLIKNCGSKNTLYLTPGPLTLWPSFCPLDSYALLTFGFLHMLFLPPWIICCLHFKIQCECHLIENTFLDFFTKTNLPTIHSHSIVHLSSVALIALVILIFGLFIWHMYFSSSSSI